MYTLQNRYWFSYKPNLLIIEDSMFEQIQKSKKLYKIFKILEQDFDNEEKLSRYIIKHPIDAIYTNIRDLKYIRKLLNLNIPIYLTYSIKELHTKKVNDSVFKNVYTLGGIKKSYCNRIAKRTLDIVGGILGCLITIPLFCILTPFIRLESKGNAIFKQKRVGVNGRIFEFYKFRSMTQNAEESKYKLMEHNEMDYIMFKIEDDPRITKVGKIIRKTSLDEFPQFFQVVKGEMTLVGTRPPTIDEYKQYNFHHKSRLTCKPGITGLWQTTGKQRETNFEKIVELDNEYIRKSSVLYDLLIIFKTIFVMFNNK